MEFVCAPKLCEYRFAKAPIISYFQHFWRMPILKWPAYIPCIPLLYVCVPCTAGKLLLLCSLFLTYVTDTLQAFLVILDMTIEIRRGEVVGKNC